MSRERFASPVVWAHLAAACAHGVSHVRVGVVPAPADTAYLAATVYLGPLLGLALLRLGRRRAGAGVLAAAMAGALVYGVTYHCVLDTPDHVAHVAHAVGGAWAAAFTATALAIAVLEALGIAAGALLWPRSVAAALATASA